MSRRFGRNQRRKIIICIAILLSGCDSGEVAKFDQCMRREIFQQCMRVVPSGPVSTKYNDWDEVVEACENAARYQSVRDARYIKPECRG